MYSRFLSVLLAASGLFFAPFSFAVEAPTVPEMKARLSNPSYLTSVLGSSLQERYGISSLGEILCHDALPSEKTTQQASTGLVNVEGLTCTVDVQVVTESGTKTCSVQLTSVVGTTWGVGDFEGGSSHSVTCTVPLK